MEDERKTKKQLIQELHELRQSVAEVENLKEEIKQTRVNQEKFTKAFLQSAIPKGITTLEDGRFIEANEAFLKFMGLTRDEVIGHTSTEIGSITAEQRDSFFSELNKRGYVENLEIEVRTKTGELRHGLFNAVMITLENKNYLLTTMVDITDRKRAEEELAKSEEKYRKLATTAHDAIITESLEGIITYANPATQNLVGVLDVVGRPAKDFIPPELISKYNEMMDARRRGYSEDIFFEWSVISHKDRSIRILDARSSVIMEGANISGMLLIGRDITERKRVETALKESEELFRNYLEHAPDGVYMSTVEGTFLYGNRKCEEIIGYQREELIGKNFLELNLLPEQSLNKAVQLLQANMEGKPTGPDEIELIRKDGRLIPLEINTSVVQRSGEKNRPRFRARHHGAQTSGRGASGKRS